MEGGEADVYSNFGRAESHRVVRVLLPIAAEKGNAVQSVAAPRRRENPVAALDEIIGPEAAVQGVSPGPVQVCKG